MAFVRTWDESDRGGQAPSTIDDLIEQLRIDLRERANVEHLTYADESGHSDVWRHRKAASRTNYLLAANAPATAAAGRVDGARILETDTGLIKYWDAANETWQTEATVVHSGLTTSYSTGSVVVTQDSATVTGTGTEWLANVTTSDVFNGPDGEFYAITSVDSDTQITLARTYDGGTASGASYVIYFDGHPLYLEKSGGTVDAATTISGILTMGAAIAMGANKITGLADGTAATDAAAYGQVAVLGFETGTYSGDGTSDRTISLTGSFTIKFLIVWEQERNKDDNIFFKTDQDGLRVKSSRDRDDWNWEVDHIVSLGAGSFVINGSGNKTAQINESGKTYTYIAFG